MKENAEEKPELPQAIVDYYDRMLLEATPDNTLALRFMEYLKHRDPLYIPEEWEDE